MSELKNYRISKKDIGEHFVIRYITDVAREIKVIGVSDDGNFVRAQSAFTDAYKLYSNEDIRILTKISY